MPYACAFTRNRAEQGVARDSRTIQSRINWWKKFCISHNIEDYELKSLHSYDKEFILMCYAIYLSMGKTIKASTISTLTLKRYLKVAGDLVGINTKFDHAVSEAELKKQKANAPVSFLIKSVIREHHRWEKMPNRREPITPKMIDFWIQQAEDADPDSFTAAIADWMIIGIKTGMRKSEWAQDTTLKHTKSGFNENVDGSCRAFIFDDFSFERENILVNRKSKTSLSLSKKYDLLRIRWRFQHNGDNGQEILFSRNQNREKDCVVEAARRIVERAQRLGVPKEHPLSGYKYNKKICYIKDTEIKKEIQSVAKQVYNLTNKAQIGRFTNHSIRVGACTLLHCGGADVLTIKTRLRWRSESFMMYLRSMPLLAAIQNKIFNLTDVDNIVT